MQTYPINRKWAMPSKNTFEIKPIKELIERNFVGLIETCDPFANVNRFAKYRNDLDPQYGTEYSMDALDFLKQFKDNSMDGVLFDPPYSPRQVSECYKKLDKTVDTTSTQSIFWTYLKQEISRILKPNGIVISFGWNTCGVGESNNCKIKEILLVSHGGWHNDTLCTVETSVKVGSPVLW